MREVVSLSDVEACTQHQLHILIVVKGLGLGGAERLIVEQVLRGRDHGVRYTVAYVRPDKTHFVTDLRDAGAEVVALAGRSPWPLRLGSLLHRSRPDVVHSHSPLPASVARLLVACRVGGVRRHTYTEHNRWQAYRPPVRWLNGMTMPLDAQVWAVSMEARSSVRPGRLRQRVEVLHHWIDVERTRLVAAQQARELSGGLPSAAGRTVLLHIANYRPEKAHEHLLASFELAASNRPDLHLWLVGQGLDAPEFCTLLDRNAARDRISLLGYRSDALGLLMLADALVLSSDHEGLPVAVMEALALGRPIVSTAVGGVPEAVRDGREGLLVPPRDVDALAGGFRKVSDEPELMGRLAAGAMARSADFDAVSAIVTQARRYRRLVSDR